MESFKFVVLSVFNMMQIPINLWGFNITLLQISVFSMLSGIFIYFIRGVFD